MKKNSTATILSLVGLLFFSNRSAAENLNASEYLSSPLQWCDRLCPEPEFDRQFLDRLRALDDDDFEKRQAAGTLVEEELYRKVLAVKHAPLCEARKVHTALSRLRLENPKLGSAEIWRGLDAAEENMQSRVDELAKRNWQYDPDGTDFFELTQGGATAEDAECETNWILARSSCEATAPTVKFCHKVEPSAQPLFVSEHQILLARLRRAVPLQCRIYGTRHYGGSLQGKDLSVFWGRAQNHLGLFRIVAKLPAVSEQTKRIFL